MFDISFQNNHPTKFDLFSTVSLSVSKVDLFPVKICFYDQHFEILQFKLSLLS